MRLTNVTDGKDQCEAGDMQATPDCSVRQKKSMASYVVMVMMTTVVVAGILLGIWLFTEHNTTTLQNTLKLVDKKTDNDVNDNILQYHMTRNSSQLSIIDDFNRGLRVVKVPQGRGQFKCLVSILQNRHDVGAVTIDTDVTQRTDEQLVKDGSFLSVAARTMCTDTPVYWSFPVVTSEFALQSEQSSDRSKRQAYSNAFCRCECGFKLCIKYEDCGSHSPVFSRGSSGRQKCNVLIGGKNSCPSDRDVVYVVGNCPATENIETPADLEIIGTLAVRGSVSAGSVTVKGVLNIG